LSVANIAAFRSSMSCSLIFGCCQFIFCFHRTAILQELCLFCDVRECIDPSTSWKKRAGCHAHHLLQLLRCARRICTKSMALRIPGTGILWTKSIKRRVWSKNPHPKRHGTFLAYSMVLITSENDRKVRSINGYIGLISAEPLLSGADSSFNALGAMFIGYCRHDNHFFCEHS